MTKAICRVDNCDSPVVSRQLCGKHVQRWRKTGTTERTVPTLADRFWVKVDKQGPVPVAKPDLGPCWLWTASLDRKGYGRFGTRKQTLAQAHRVAYELSVGPIPVGLDLDHLCRVRHCVNPGHLEPVTRRVNLLRGETLPAREVLITHCPEGHPYDAQNTYWYGNNRKCRICRRAQRNACNERQRRKRAGLAA